VELKKLLNISMMRIYNIIKLLFKQLSIKMRSCNILLIWVFLVIC